MGGLCTASGKHPILDTPQLQQVIDKVAVHPDISPASDQQDGGWVLRGAGGQVGKSFQRHLKARYLRAAFARQGRRRRQALHKVSR